MQESSSATRGAGSPSKIGQHPRSRVKQFAPHTIHDVGRGYAEDVELFVDALLANVTFRQVLLNNYDPNSTVLDVAGDDDESLDAALREFPRERAVAARDVEHGAIWVITQQHLAERDVREQRVDEQLHVLRVAATDVVHLSLIHI